MQFIILADYPKFSTQGDTIFVITFAKKKENFQEKKENDNLCVLILRPLSFSAEGVQALSSKYKTEKAVLTY